MWDLVKHRDSFTFTFRPIQDHEIWHSQGDESNRSPQGVKPCSEDGGSRVHRNAEKDSQPLPGLEPPDHTARSPALYQRVIPALALDTAPHINIMSSLSRERVCHVTGHSPCLCQLIYTYVHFEPFFYIFVLTVLLHFKYSVSMYPPGLSAQVLYSRLRLFIYHLRI
jgi:hypothetical protein